jgi:transposase InsO family protein
LETRKIIQWSLARYPKREFVRKQIITFSEKRSVKSYLIHDRSPELFQNYEHYNITGITTSVEAPNMNAYAERFVRSIRNDDLDNFIIFSEQQLQTVITQYIDYYNGLRPHQGIGQHPPDGYTPQTEGTVVSKPVLSGLHHHYHHIPA